MDFKHTFRWVKECGLSKIGLFFREMVKANGEIAFINFAKNKIGCYL